MRYISGSSRSGCLPRPAPYLALSPWRWRTDEILQGSRELLSSSPPVFTNSCFYGYTVRPKRQGPELLYALDTTLASLATPRDKSGDYSFCLCHGMAGNAEILVQIHDLTGRTGLREAAIALADEGMRRHHGSGTWPCGIPQGGESPSLLPGLAGIGYFYLRLHDPSIPSPLML